MTEHTKTELAQNLKQWLKSEKIVAQTRQFLGGQGLSETKIANWSRADRDIPETFLEGAALHYCANTSTIDLRAAERTNLVGDRFWQIFIVSPEISDQDGNHDCFVLRFWEGVRQYNQSRGEIDLTHRTWFTGSANNNPITDLISGEAILQHNGPDETRDGWTFIDNPSVGERGREISLTWKIKDNDTHNYGYAVRLSGTVASFPPNGQRHEYLGGLSVIPVASHIIIAVLPHNLLKKTNDVLDEFKFARPQCLEFLADGVPIRMLEGFLQGKLTRKHLAPWFDNKGRAKIWNESDIDLPLPVQKFLQSQGLSLSNELDTIFVTEIESPAPYLYQSLVFELPGGNHDF
jgi:hypothetical protein